MLITKQKALSFNVYCESCDALCGWCWAENEKQEYCWRHEAHKSIGFCLSKKQTETVNSKKTNNIKLEWRTVWRRASLSTSASSKKAHFIRFGGKNKENFSNISSILCHLLIVKVSWFFSSLSIFISLCSTRLFDC